MTIKIINRAVAEGSRLLAQVKSYPKRLITMTLLCLITITANAEAWIYNYESHYYPTAPKVITKKDCIIKQHGDWVEIESGNILSVYHTVKGFQYGSPTEIHRTAHGFGYQVVYTLDDKATIDNNSEMKPLNVVKVFRTTQEGKLLNVNWVVTYPNGEMITWVLSTYNE